MIQILMAAAVILVTALRFVPRRGKWTAGAAVLGVLLCLGGALCIAMAFGDAAALRADALPDAETAAWAYDMMRGWFSFAGTASLVMGIPLLLAALIRHKMVWMRTLCAPCAAILIQLAAAAYVVICRNDAVDFTPIIRLFSTGCGALMLCGTAVDAIRFAVSGQGSLARKTMVKTASRGREKR